MAGILTVRKKKKNKLCGISGGMNNYCAMKIKIMQECVILWPSKAVLVEQGDDIFAELLKFLQTLSF